MTADRNQEKPGTPQLSPGTVVALRVTACSALALTLFAQAAASDIPDPFESRVAPNLVVCPQGDMPFLVVVRSGLGVPQSGERLSIRLSSCPSLGLCEPIPEGEYDWNPLTREASRLTDANGEADIRLRASGSCPKDSVVVHVNIIVLGRRALASVDVDGNGVVESADQQTVQDRVGGTDPATDFDGDGFVTEHDVEVVGAHLGHSCGGITPTVRSTFSRVRAAYR